MGSAQAIWRMDKRDLRIAGAEKAIVTLAAHLDAIVVQASRKALTAELAQDLSADERATILQALELLDDGSGV